MFKKDNCYSILMNYKLRLKKTTLTSKSVCQNFVRLNLNGALQLMRQVLTMYFGDVYIHMYVYITKVQNFSLMPLGGIKVIKISWH